ncbi:hypothetical protein [Mesorhizobium sp. Pch-S]|uniref:hypothetical protein n=1 Tax=Mesorhizobium sp. Pch-S TaxID=2082387 RepID=UPI0010139BA3|nr:hypothetical protein [Mesorhizobium sp. Pch-S]QAZ45904.1 hypothetical protein C1M53_26315 [Mesorhizobium sp. Pch-S]
MAGTRDFYTMKMLARIADAPDGIAVQFVPDRIASELRERQFVEQIGFMLVITDAGREALKAEQGR